MNIKGTLLNETMPCLCACSSSLYFFRFPCFVAETEFVEYRVRERCVLTRFVRISGAAVCRRGSAAEEGVRFWMKAVFVLVHFCIVFLLSLTLKVSGSYWFACDVSCPSTNVDPYEKTLKTMLRFQKYSRVSVIRLSVGSPTRLYVQFV